MPRPCPARAPLRFLRTLAAGTRGATAVEYGLILALIALAIAGSLSRVSGGINGTFNTIGNAMTSRDGG